MSTDWRNDPAWTAYVGAHPRASHLALEHDGDQAVEAYKRTLKTRIVRMVSREAMWNAALAAVLAVLEES